MNATSPAPSAPRAHPPSRFDWLGLPPGMAWPIVGLMVFVVGDSLELSWITGFFARNIGIATDRAAWIVTAFGAVSVVASFLVGPTSALLGPRRTMLLGLVTWCLVDAAFIGLALPSHDYRLILVTYALRGLGTPLYALALLTELNDSATRGREASAQAWFWFALSGGQQVGGALLAGLLLDRAGAIATLWVGLLVTLAGGLAGVCLLRPLARSPQPGAPGGLTGKLAAAVSIVWRLPRVGAGGLVKLINIGAILGVYVFYIPYLNSEFKVPLGQGAVVFALLGVTGVPGNLVWGWVSDRIGWANTVQWIACPINALAIAALYYAPRVWGADAGVIAAIMFFWGVGTSAFVPLSALVPALAPSERALALGVVNVASASAVVVGPAIVAACLGHIGYGGITFVLVGSFILAFALMFYVQLPAGARTTADDQAARLEPRAP